MTLSRRDGQISLLLRQCVFEIDAEMKDGLLSSAQAYAAAVGRILIVLSRRRVLPGLYSGVAARGHSHDGNWAYVQADSGAVIREPIAMRVSMDET
ncbi:hypothetical protein CKAH01_06065 [Colletotrichum kahawae]|uniref:Uncharacterized protein n=1 Tax=Colletotrichum kahawae TaxID=34407 RepID=A0AAD9YB86_COLKA|nr:hypothetical protein CKAH01_06065 [Colletotrichum kahawae]